MNMLSKPPTTIKASLHWIIKRKQLISYFLHIWEYRENIQRILNMDIKRWINKASCASACNRSWHSGTRGAYSWWNTIETLRKGPPLHNGAALTRCTMLSRDATLSAQLPLIYTHFFVNTYLTLRMVFITTLRRNNMHINIGIVSVWAR